MSRRTGDFQEDLLNQYQKGFNLLQRAHHIERHAIREQTQDEEGAGIPRGQGKLLRLLLAKDGLFIKDIVLELDIRPSSASQLITKVEGRGLVTRIEVTEDKRVRKVVLTDLGRSYAEKIKATHAGIYKELFVGLSADEQKQLSELLKKLNTSLDDKVAADEKVALEGRGHQHRSHNSHSQGRKRDQVHSISGRKRHKDAD
jgi:DNA-binding MarR family transcriptional regulator